MESQTLDYKPQTYIFKKANLQYQIITTQRDKLMTHTYTYKKIYSGKTENTLS